MKEMKDGLARLFALTLGEVPETIPTRDLQKWLGMVLETLTPNERKVLELRYGLVDQKKWSLNEIGRKLKVTGNRVRQIEGKAKRKLMHPSRMSFLEGYKDPRNEYVMVTVGLMVDSPEGHNHNLRQAGGTKVLLFKAVDDSQARSIARKSAGMGMVGPETFVFRTSQNIL